MTKHAEPPDRGTPGLPVIFIVDPDQAARESVESALLRRFSADYQVLTANSAEAGIETLERLARQAEEVALVAVDPQLPDLEGVEFLERARALHRSASRALLVAMDRRGTRIPFGILDSLQRATVLGRIDFWFVKGWDAPEELLYPYVQEALTAWTRANHPRHEVVRVVGERWSPRSHELRDALARNTVPFGFYVADSDEGGRLLRDHDVDTGRLPVVILHDGTVLHNPSLVDVADALGVQTQPSSETYDLAILGAGPSGLSAAVYGSSEGLRTVVIEPQAIGGQAGTSSMIRNYLGFPRGVSGSELTFRAWEQALVFGTEFVFTQHGTGVRARDHEVVITLSNGTEVKTRAVILAAGVAYRRLGIESLDRLVGAGVFYGSANVEAPAMTGADVYVVGGANSSGQAALHLARFAARVTLVIRSNSLASMSDYLISQLQATPNIDIRLRTRVADGKGEDRLESLTVEHVATGAREEVPAAAVFILIGAEPHTEWLRDIIQCDRRGYVLTDRDLELSGWPLKRPPLPFETSMPGVFAVGDVRHGSVMRVAGAVGEGSVAVGSVHKHLSDVALRSRQSAR
jgi:thioredoxin reductase (NADPH)